LAAGARRRAVRAAPLIGPCCRFYLARAPAPMMPGRSSGGSGVIWSAGPAPGLTPSPGRSWPLSAAAVPISALQCCPSLSDAAVLARALAARRRMLPAAAGNAPACAGSG